jgi:hypothetical protein
MAITHENLYIHHTTSRTPPCSSKPHSGAAPAPVGTAQQRKQVGTVITSTSTSHQFMTRKCARVSTTVPTLQAHNIIPVSPQRRPLCRHTTSSPCLHNGAHSAGTQHHPCVSTTAPTLQAHNIIPVSPQRRSLCRHTSSPPPWPSSQDPPPSPRQHLTLQSSLHCSCNHSNPLFVCVAKVGRDVRVPPTWCHLLLPLRKSVYA